MKLPDHDSIRPRGQRKTPRRAYPGMERRLTNGRGSVKPTDFFEAACAMLCCRVSVALGVELEKVDPSCFPQAASAVRPPRGSTWTSRFARPARPLSSI